MIVLDTGSTDATPAVASAQGAEVHAFSWCDDFSAARNAALAHSDADWNLILDADEWIEQGAGLVGLPAAGGFLGRAQVASAMAEDGSLGLARSWIARVLPRGVGFEGAVHEQPNGSLPERRLEVRIGHDGYLPQSLARKAGRNERLLLREVEANPSDGYLWFQLGREHQARERWAEAAEAFVRAYNLTRAEAPYRHALVVRAITALKTAGRIDEATELADHEIANWRHSPDFFFAVGDLYLERASREPDRAFKDFLPVAEYAWKQCLEIGDRDDLEGSVQGRGGFMAAHNLAVMFGTVGLKELAAEYQAMADRMRPAA